MWTLAPGPSPRATRGRWLRAETRSLNPDSCVRAPCMGEDVSQSHQQRCDLINTFPKCIVLFSSKFFILGFPGGSAGKEPACNARELGSIPGLGRSPGEETGYPLQESGLENSMDGIVHGVTESDTTERLSPVFSIVAAPITINIRGLPSLHSLAVVML